MNIAISGANGFIGRNLISCLKQMKHISLITISRNPSDELKENTNEYSYEDLYNGLLNNNIELFIHLASPNYDYCKDNSLHEGIVDLTQSILKSLKIYTWTSKCPLGDPLDPWITKMVSQVPKMEHQGLQNASFRY